MDEEKCICSKRFSYTKEDDDPIWLATVLDGPLHVHLGGMGGDNYVVIDKITGATCARDIRVSMDTYENHTFEWIISTTIDEGEEGYDAESPNYQWKEIIRIPFQGKI